MVATSRCPQCGSTAVRALFAGLDAEDTRRPPIPILQCGNCDLAFSDLSSFTLPATDLYFDGYYGEGVADRPVNRSMINVFQREREALALTGLDGGTILDVGCGDGTFLRNLPASWNTFGYETSAVGQRALRRAGITPLDMYAADAERERFDVITLWHSFEHVTDPARLLDTARQLLKKDGRLFISVPNFDSWQARLFRTRWFHLDPTRHCFHYTPRTLRRVIEAHGFTVQQLTTKSWEYGIAGWWQSLFNVTPLEFNMGYKVLKARKRYERSARTAASLGAYGILAAPVAAVSVMMMLLETAARRGGAVHAMARPR